MLFIIISIDLNKWLLYMSYFVSLYIYVFLDIQCSLVMANISMLYIYNYAEEYRITSAHALLLILD